MNTVPEKRQIAQFITMFCEQYAEHRRAKYFVRKPKDLTLARMLLETYGLDDLREMVRDMLTVKDDWLSNTDRGVGILTVKASWLAGRLADRRGRQEGAGAADWYDECQRLHGGACGLSQFRHHLAMQKARTA